MTSRYRIDSKSDIDKESMIFNKNGFSEIMLEMLFLDYGKEVNGKLINKLDLFNLKGLSDKEIEKLLNKFLINKTKEIESESNIGTSQVTIDNPEAIDYFNYIFKQSLDFYEEELKGNIPKKYKNRKKYFNKKEDIINFLKDTTKGVISSQFNCSIAKISYAINEIIDTPELVELDKKSIYLAREKIIPSTMIDDYEMLMNLGCSKGRTIIGGKIIEFKLRIRGKEHNSGTFKILKDEKYINGKSLNDSIGIEFEVKNKEDALLLLSYFYLSLFHNRIEEGELINTVNSFKNKGIIDKELVEKMEKEGLITGDFLNLIKNLHFNPNPMQNQDYKDVKIIGEVDLPINLNDSKSQKKGHSVELRMILVGNKNEEGLSDHRILEVGKIILTWIRLKGYISEPFIKKLINELLNEYKDLDEKFKKEEILNYFKSKLIPVEKKGNAKLYTVKSRNMLDIYSKI
ncbi:MAG: hypothetical protein PHS49_01755 [Candidatus Gracilibacteria bacterium]|nr:hypothetical protein [Candidatus Gracilibacteria bacterium]